MTERCSIRMLHDTTCWVLLGLLILASTSALPTAHANDELPVARIVGVESPPRVLPGQNFTVLVTVDYSARYSTDIGIKDARTGFVLASKGLIIPAGTNVFTFSLIGRDDPGVWSLVTSVRVWWQSGWYADQNGGTFAFEITVSDPLIATLTVRSNLASATMKIDGVTYSASPKGLELSTKRGLHMIEVEPLLMLGEGTKAVFDHWSDGVQSSSRQIYVPERLDISAVYLTEFFLNAESSMGETVGSGWYPVGTNATFATLDNALPEHSASGIQPPHKFSHWSGDCNSTSSTAWVEMDRPKTVVANWSEDTSHTSEPTITYQLVIISLVFLSCSVMLIAVGIALRRKKRDTSYSVGPRRKAIITILLLALVFSAAFGHLQIVQPVNALTLLQPESITIGDAVWYHWNATTSDTCLIWLGGGLVGKSSYIVNPLEFESYNTVRFIQDLAQYYGVLALKKGSMRTVDSALNKTVYGEPYPGSDDFVEKIRLWALDQGYTYVYLVGYSVGAMVAAQELVLANPNGWISPNGLIIITTKIPSSRAGSLRASLLMLYGDKVAPEFTESGQQFFQSAPEDGWKDEYYFHKEYHLIPGVEHEVWTILDSGEYDGRAALLTVKFIEATKSLQFGRVNEDLSKIALNSTVQNQTGSSLSVRIKSVQSPAKARTEEIFKAAAAVQYEFPSNATVAVVAFDANTRSVLSAAQKHLTGSSETQFVTTLVSGNVNGTWRFSLIPLVYSQGGLPAVAGAPNHVIVDVTDSFTLTLIVSYASLPVQIDEKTFNAEINGQVAANLSPGEHSISVPSLVTLGNSSRAVFEGWNDTFSSASMRLNLSGDLTLLAIYRRQYYLSVSSPFGQVAGSGWYDENSTARFQLAPPLTTGEVAHAFIGWSDESVDSSPASSVFMNSPKDIGAVWKDLTSPASSATPAEPHWLLILSSIILITSLIFVVISALSKHRTMASDASMRPT